MATDNTFLNSRGQWDRMARNLNGRAASWMPTRWLASLLSVDWLKAMRDRHLCSPDRLEILIDRAASEGKMTSGEADYLAVQAVVYEGGGGEVELHVLIYPAIEKVLPDDSAEARQLGLAPGAGCCHDRLPRRRRGGNIPGLRPRSNGGRAVLQVRRA